MNLIVALEEEFGIEFDDNDIENLLNFQLINLTIKECIDNN
jgi:acyl carrier protein